MQFTERGGLEKGFRRVFAKQVRPGLMALEQQRVARKATVRRWLRRRRPHR